MIEEINWKNRTTYALGRNGDSKCTGVELMEIYSDDADRHCVEISPLNTRSGVTRCHIDIPLESIPEVIKKLEKIHAQEKFFVEKGEK